MVIATDISWCQLMTILQHVNTKIETLSFVPTTMIVIKPQSWERGNKLLLCQVQSLIEITHLCWRYLVCMVIHHLVPGGSQITPFNLLCYFVICNYFPSFHVTFCTNPCELTIGVKSMAISWNWYLLTYTTCVIIQQDKKY